MSVFNHCPRCAGLMVAEFITGGLADATHGFQWWSCICCGNKVDFIILRNQLRPRLLKEARIRKVPVFCTA